MIKRAIYLMVCGIFLAGIIHIIVILLIPHFSSKDAAKQIMSNAKLLQFSQLEQTSSLQIGDIDPFFNSRVCRFDLNESAIFISGDKVEDFWSASIFDQDGRVIYSLNDRTAIRNILKILIVNPIQMADIRQAQPEEVETSIIVESPANEGFVILRALVRDESQTTEIDTFLNSIKCDKYLTR